MRILYSDGNTFFAYLQRIITGCLPINSLTHPSIEPARKATQTGVVSL